VLLLPPGSSVRRPVPLVLCLFAGCTAAVAPAAGGSGADPAIVARIDSIIEARTGPGKAAGAAVAVVRGSDTLVMKGYGYADLEFEVPMPANAIFEIGSVTKQFTAAAMLRLVEQGKLALDDDLAKHLPDYPVRGHRIPIRRLLDHTSGIKGYTEIPEFGWLRLQKLPKDTLVKIVGRYPFDFPTGEELIYNNSAYFLAGLIIEKASGMSYADFVKQELFDRAGMPDSRYCSENEIVKRRAHGYDAADTTGRLVRAAYLDHTWPYAAGSLCSTVGDLLAWNRALHGGQVLSPAMYQAMITPGTLNDGTPVRYALGLATVPLAGRKAIWHDGGINGFISLNRYLPDDSLHVIVLWNSTGPDLDVGEAVIRAVLGPGPDDAQPFEGDASAYTGTWSGRGRGRGLEVKIAAEGGVVTMVQGDETDTLTWVGNDTFRSGGTLLSFERDGGRPARARLDGGYISVRLSRK